MAEAALGLQSLSLHEQNRVWKALDWDLMDVLFQRGWIRAPKSKAKSVMLTPTGAALAREFLGRHFGAQPRRGK